MKNVLSIDGGGARGYLPCSLLIDLERLSGKPLHEQFDLVAGTSIGGVLALLLSLGVPAAEAIKFFTEDGPKIFKRRWWRNVTGLPKYPAAGIEAALQARLRSHRLSDCRTKVLVTACELTQQRPAFFRDGSATPAWVAARATSAAQTYFPVFHWQDWLYWDGGNVANNPAGCALAEARKCWPDERVRVLSLGCGPSPASVNTRLIDWAPFAAVATVGMLFEDAAEEVDFKLRQDIGADYVRLQPQPLRPLALDDASPAGLLALMLEAKRARQRFAPELAAWLASA